MPPVDFSPLENAEFPAFEPGSVWLVGAGPGAPGLLTLLGYSALSRADVVVYDGLVNEAVLNWVRDGAVLEHAGKRGGRPSPHQADITLRLIALAREGKRVLRLKGGDPFVFGRGGEECQALAEAGVPFRIVPGISAGIGGLAYAGIPTTHRLTNHSVMFLTGHDSSGQVPSAVNWPQVATAAPVLVIYMALRKLPEIAATLLANGRAAEDLVAILSNASLPQQSVMETTLGALTDPEVSQDLPTPAIVVVGEVVRFRGEIEWYGPALRSSAMG
jgi:uroporphyrin-III C-methyltransferase